MQETSVDKNLCGIMIYGCGEFGKKHPNKHFDSLDTITYWLGKGYSVAYVYSADTINMEEEYD